MRYAICPGPHRPWTSAPRYRWGSCFGAPVRPDPCGLGQQVFSHFLRGWGAHMGEELTEVGKTFFRTAPHSLVLYLSTWCPWAYELAVTLPSRLLPTLFRNDYKFLTNSTLDIKYSARIYFPIHYLPLVVKFAFRTDSSWDYLLKSPPSLKSHFTKLLLWQVPIQVKQERIDGTRIKCYMLGCINLKLYLSLSLSTHARTYYWTWYG